MLKSVVELEESRLDNIADADDYIELHFHERHRVFPAVFEERRHRRILDIAAGVGCIASRIRDRYPADLVCNDISPTCLRILGKLGATTVSFDIDDDTKTYPFPDRDFDAVIATVTIEHVIHIDHFLREIRRILSDDGHLYISAPNYSGLIYLPRFLMSGKSFHDPLGAPIGRYEFYAHVRYFTYRTLLEFVSSFGFTPEAVYLAAPRESSYYQSLYAASRVKALAYRLGMQLMYRLLSPRWAAEPILCLQKGDDTHRKPRKVVL